mmetsp:Transcript_65243/g.183658  ORF Transcript_65243/g.183658 Transcript_65243/m.183658 type:complete len:353 (-) Transcript_65243:283-1341(-)
MRPGGVRRAGQDQDPPTCGEDRERGQSEPRDGRGPALRRLRQPGQRLQRAGHRGGLVPAERPGRVPAVGRAALPREEPRDRRARRHARGREGGRPVRLGRPGAGDLLRLRLAGAQPRGDDGGLRHHGQRVRPAGGKPAERARRAARGALARRRGQRHRRGDAGARGRRPAPEAVAPGRGAAQQPPGAGLPRPAGVPDHAHGGVREPAAARRRAPQHRQPHDHQLPRHRGGAPRRVRRPAAGAGREGREGAAAPGARRGARREEAPGVVVAAARRGGRRRGVHQGPARRGRSRRRGDAGDAGLRGRHQAGDLGGPGAPAHAAVHPRAMHRGNRAPRWWRIHTEYIRWFSGRCP